MRRPISASWSIVAHGCSTYSRSNGASAWMACSASSTFQPPLASTRMRPSGPSASRTARTRATSAPRVPSADRDLDLRRTASGEHGEHRAHAVGVDRRNGRVDRDPVAQRGRRRVPAVVDRRGEPGGCLVVVVLDEGRELRPPLRSLEEHRLAHVDAAEAGHEGEGDHPRGGEQLVEGGQGRGVVGHPPIVAPTGPRHPEFRMSAPIDAVTVPTTVSS